MVRLENVEHSQEITVMDFSEASVRKAVREKGLYHPVTLYSPAVGLGMVFLTLLFSFPGYLYLIGAALVVAGVSNGGARIFFLRDKIAQDFHRMKRMAIESQAAKETRDLEAELDRLGLHRSARQVIMLKEAFLGFRDKVNLKIPRTEGAYDQYIGSAEVMYLSAMKNLRKVRDLMQDNRKIDVEYARETIDELEGDDGFDHSNEIRQLGRRIEIFNENEVTAKKLISEVTGIITVIQDETQNLNDLEVSRDQISASVRRAMQIFQDTAARNERIYKSAAATYRAMTGNGEPLIRLQKLKED